MNAVRGFYGMLPLLTPFALAGCGTRDARIEVMPPDAEVLFEGCIVPGNGAFPLPLAGRRKDRHYRLEIRREGYRSISFDISWSSEGPLTYDEALDGLGIHDYKPDGFSVPPRRCCCCAWPGYIVATPWLIVDALCFYPLGRSRGEFWESYREGKTIPLDGSQFELEPVPAETPLPSSEVKH